MIRIGDFSKLSRISIRMLRHYDELGLLKPEDVDRLTGYRYYSLAQLRRANRIAMLRDMGFNLASIAEILKLKDDPEALRAFLSVKLEEVKEQEQEAQKRIALIERTLKQLRKEQEMEYDVTLKTMPQRYVASLRKVIPTYQDESTLWHLMGQETGKELRMATPSYSLAVFHDEGHKESDVDVEIQIAVLGEHEDTDNVIFKTVGPIEIASAVYKGSYDQITEVNEAVASWVSDNDFEYSGPMFCIYHVSPGHDPNPENWVTEICYPIRKK